jgi:D-lyxose ketol-isomerase
MPLDPQLLDAARQRALEMLSQAGIVVTAEEARSLDVADFALDDWEQTGLIELVYVNTERHCAKELILSANQTCPEHRHPPVGDREGKEESFRCRWGSAFLYVPGPSTPEPLCRPPVGSEDYYTVLHEIPLQPGGQHTIPPDTLHWFRAGPQGAIVSEFSTASFDDTDVFTDPRIVWAPE